MARRRGATQGTTPCHGAAVRGEAGHGWRGEAARERERKEQNEEDKMMSVFFANVRHHGATWHATSASDARVTGLGPLVKHLMYFRDLDERFESLGT